EVHFMRTEWAHVLLVDKAYNPALTLDDEDFGLAWPPRYSARFSPSLDGVLRHVHNLAPCPCGSVVEHSLGKGEVGSSILPMGTTPPWSGKRNAEALLWDLPIGTPACRLNLISRHLRPNLQARMSRRN